VIHDELPVLFAADAPLHDVPVDQPARVSHDGHHRVPFPTEEERPLAGALPNRRATPSSLVRAAVNGRFVDPDEVIPGEPLAFLHEIRPLVLARLGRALGQQLASDSQFVAQAAAYGRQGDAPTCPRA
jgi:hypothetical protein